MAQAPGEPCCQAISAEIDRAGQKKSDAIKRVYQLERELRVLIPRSDDLWRRFNACVGRSGFGMSRDVPDHCIPLYHQALDVDRRIENKTNQWRDARRQYSHWRGIFDNAVERLIQCAEQFSQQHDCYDCQLGPNIGPEAFSATIVETGCPTDYKCCLGSCLSYVTVYKKEIIVITCDDTNVTTLYVTGSCTSGTSGSLEYSFGVCIGGSVTRVICTPVDKVDPCP